MFNTFLVLVLQALAPELERPPTSARTVQAQPQPPAQSQATAQQQVTAQRNENIQINQINNDAIIERLGRDGAQARPIQEFSAVRADYGAPFGGIGANINIINSDRKTALHGEAYETLQNSVFNARTFFQVGPVRTTRRNQYGFNIGGPIVKNRLSFFVNGEEIRQSGYVNGNVLVPLADERTPRSTDAAINSVIGRWLKAYPDELPNRTEIDPRMLNTNALQKIRTSGGAFRLDWDIDAKLKLTSRYSLQDTFQDSFEFMAGQNPDQRLRPQALNLSLTERLSDRTVVRYGANYNRAKIFLLVPSNAVGPQIFLNKTVSDFGPPEVFPIRRIRNDFEYLLQVTQARGRHQLDWGAEVRRFQMNDIQSDETRGTFSFNPNFGRTAMENFLLGLPTQYRVSIGNPYRGFRNTDLNFFVNDKLKVTSALQLSLGLRYEYIGKASEVNALTELPYASDNNNVAPRFGFSYRLGGQTIRGGYGIAFGRIFPATFQWARFNPPAFQRYFISNPDLLNPLKEVSDLGQSARSTLNLLDPTIVSPYSQQYTLEIQRDLPAGLRLTASYVGSRTWKLFQMMHANRPTRPEGILVTTGTINDRRPDSRYFSVNTITNMGRAYFDAAQLSLQRAVGRGLTFTATYQFAKAIDTGADFASTAVNNDEAKAQREDAVIQDLKALSKFDTPHRLLFTYTYALPTRWLRGWSVTGAVNLHSGTPFMVDTGSDSPPWGNVDGQGQDRPSLLDLSLLGRSVDNPDASQSVLRREAFVTEGLTRGWGTLGRNTFRKDGVANFNVALERTLTMFNDRARTATFRAEALNLTNHPQFDAPIPSVSSPGFGRITNTLNGGRVVQFGVNLKF